MITRVWHGRTRLADAERYLAFLLDEGTKEYLEIKGNRSVKVWRKMHEAEYECEFYTVTEWINIESIKKFAGTDPSKAVYYPFDEGMLLEFEDEVKHYENYDVSSAKIKEYIRQITQLINGGSWQGESFKGKLKNVSQEKAFLQPIENAHCIASILSHCTHWHHRVINRITKERRRNPIKHNFLSDAQLREIGWEAVKRSFYESTESLLNKLQNKTDQFLSAPTTRGTIEDELIGVIHHSTYHLGQIALLQKSF